jgi:ribosomal protein S12 methylthiotransferase
MNRLNRTAGIVLDSRIRVHMVSLGCAKNLVDSEAMCGILTDNDFLMIEDPAEAQVIVVNTCGFIESAKKEAIDRILAMADYKRTASSTNSPPGSDPSTGRTISGSCDFLIVAGCLAQRYSGNIRASIPEVDAILGTSEYGSIAETIRLLYERNRGPLPDGVTPSPSPSSSPSPSPSSPPSSSPIVRTDRSAGLAHLKERRLLSTRGYAYLKIAEGCSNHCTYCAIPGIRGDFRSRDIDELVAEAKALADKGIYEIVLIAQDTTRYGLDIYGTRKLPALIHEISLISAVRRIRVLYCYSDGITPELIEEMRSNPKVAHYIEMPIQHASDSVLRRMNRRDTARSIEHNIRALRKAIPGITIRTTVLVGFPGETDEEFDELHRFVERMRFDLLGCFVFSPEEGTLAFDMKPKVPKSVARSRYHRIMALQKSIASKKALAILKKRIKITVESISEDGIFYLGRGDAQAPEIDPPVSIVATDEPLIIGNEYDVRIVDVSDNELTGVIIP